MYPHHFPSSFLRQGSPALRKFTSIVGFTIFAFSGFLMAENIVERDWRITLESEQMGPVETILIFKKNGAGYRAHTRSGALEEIRKLPNVVPFEADLQPGVFAFELNVEGDELAGPVIAPWRDGQVTLSQDGETLSGKVDGGMFAGSFTGVPVQNGEALRDYPALLKAFDRVVAEKIFDPEDLKRKEYQHFREAMGAVADSAKDDLDLLMGFKFAWTGKPFSHFQLRRFPAPAEQIIGSFERMKVGYEAARVDFDGDIAVLRVDTMMGNDTIEQIDAAYDRIAEKKSKSLIIDLRGNGGGAFAVKPLVQHVIDQQLDAGYFISQKWNTQHDRPPTARELVAAVTLSGTSIIEFWRSVQKEPLLRVQFHPAEPHFSGSVYVLTDSQSASATEMAVDALRALGRVTVIGEPTAGQMLSQSFFDVADGFVVSLPVADYYSVEHGRIEGVGIPVDEKVEPEQALKHAKLLIRESH